MIKSRISNIVHRSSNIFMKVLHTFLTTNKELCSEIYRPFAPSFCFVKHWWLTRGQPFFLVPFLHLFYQRRLTSMSASHLFPGKLKTNCSKTIRYKIPRKQIFVITFEHLIIITKSLSYLDLNQSSFFHYISPFHAK